MTTLTVHHADGSGVHKAPTTDFAAIVRDLKGIDIKLERWPVKQLAKEADAKAVLALYADEVEQLNRANGFQSVDAIRMTPASPGIAEMRAKFLSEHTHDDDEVRYFVEGSGAFYIHNGALVYQIICTKGDLISVPSGTTHWFDTGPKPKFTVIRFFTNPEGWVAKSTGDDVANRIPTYEQVAA